MKNLFASLFVLLVSAAAFAQVDVGDVFPTIEGTTLEDNVISVPTDTKDKVTVLLVAYTAEAQDGSKVWKKHFWEEFMDPNGMGSKMYNCNTYFMFMMTGIKKLAYGPAIKKIKPGTDAALYPHVILTKQDVKFYKENLAFKDKDQPNIYVIDTRGKIVHREYGRYTDEKMARIQEKVGEL